MSLPLKNMGSLLKHKEEKKILSDYPSAFSTELSLKPVFKWAESRTSCVIVTIWTLRLGTSPPRCHSLKSLLALDTLHWILADEVICFFQLCWYLYSQPIFTPMDLLSEMQENRSIIL